MDLDEVLAMDGDLFLRRREPPARIRRSAESAAACTRRQELAFFDAVRMHDSFSRPMGGFLATSAKGSRGVVTVPDVAYLSLPSL
jgi:hypothetical protein